MSLSIYNNNTLVAAQQESNPVTISLPSAVDLSATAIAAAATAESSATLSYEWANNPEDVVVSGGEYSSYHWARKAAASAASINPSNYQPKDDTLTSIAALGTVSGKFIYTTDVDTWVEATITTWGRGRLADADQTAAQTALGLGSGALYDVSSNTDLSVDPTLLPTRDAVAGAISAATSGGSTVDAVNIRNSFLGSLSSATSNPSEIVGIGNFDKICLSGSFDSSSGVSFQISLSSDNGTTWGSWITLYNTNISFNGNVVVSKSDGKCFFSGRNTNGTSDVVFSEYKTVTIPTSSNALRIRMSSAFGSFAFNATLLSGY